MIDARQTKLEELLGVPNPQSWKALTALLLAWEGQPGFDAALATAGERLDRWPDRLRRAEGGRGSAVLSLARSCHDSETTNMVERGVADRISTVMHVGNKPAFLGQLRAVTSLLHCGPGALDALDETTLASLVEVGLSEPTLAELSLLVEKAPKLERLILLPNSKVKVGQQGLEILASGRLRLTHLLMGGQDLKGAKAGKTLATGAAFSELQYLDLSDNPLSDGFFKAFLARTHASLSFLRLHYVKMGSLGLDELTASKSLPALESLDLSADSRRDLGGQIARLATLGHFPRLRRLDIEGLCASNDTMLGLLSSSGLPHLEELRLDGALDLPTLIPALPRTLTMPLRKLAFRGRAEKDLPWERLEWFRDLRVLSIPHQLRAGGAEAFLTRAPISGLTALNLLGGELHGTGASLLAKVPFTRLRRLHVFATKLFPDVIVPLLDAPWLAELEEISVDRQEVGAEAMQRLEQVVERMGSGEVLPSVSARDIEWFDPLAEDSLGGAPPTAPTITSAPAARESAPASEPVAVGATAENLAPFASSAAACGPILGLVSELVDEATFGEAKLEKGKLTLDRGDWKLCVVIKSVPKGLLEPWERSGIALSVEVTARIPKLERALEPSLTDKEYAKLPYSEDAAVRPTLVGSLRPPEADGWQWHLDRVGGPHRMAAHIVESLRQWVPVMSSVERIAQRAAHASEELQGKGFAVGEVSRKPKIFFGITAGLTAALAFFVMGDASRAREALAAWLAHPDNQRLLGNSDMSTSREGISFSSREARGWVDKLKDLVPPR